MCLLWLKSLKKDIYILQEEDINLSHLIFRNIYNNECKIAARAVELFICSSVQRVTTEKLNNLQHKIYINTGGRRRLLKACIASINNKLYF